MARPDPHRPDPPPAAGVVRAAGAVLWRPAPKVPGGLEVALVHRPRHDDWSLPKGKLEPGEHPLAAAVREVEEETGFVVSLGPELGVRSYAVGERLKIVRYWAGRARAGTFRPNDEVDQVVWLPAVEASRRCTRPPDGVLPMRLLDGPPPGQLRPVIVVRHASAVPRGVWRGADVERPLTSSGAEHAAALATLLAGYGPPTRVVSSPAWRCVATVRPYRERTGAPIRTDSGLAEGAGPGETAAALRRAVEPAVPDEHGVTVLCTHRPVLPRLLPTGVGVGPGRADDELLLPGEFAVLHRHGAQVLTVDRYAPYPVDF